VNEAELNGRLSLVSYPFNGEDLQSVLTSENADASSQMSVMFKKSLESSTQMGLNITTLLGDAGQKSKLELSLETLRRRQSRIIQDGPKCP